MYLYKAYLVRVVNGGLIKATIDLGFGVMLSSMPIHLVNIDAPHGIDGQKATDYLKTLLPTTFTLKTKMDGSMILGEVQVKGTSINEKMLDSGLVKKFGK